MERSQTRSTLCRASQSNMILYKSVAVAICLASVIVVFSLHSSSQPALDEMLNAQFLNASLDNGRAVLSTKPTLTLKNFDNISYSTPITRQLNNTTVSVQSSKAAETTEGLNLIAKLISDTSGNSDTVSVAKAELLTSTKIIKDSLTSPPSSSTSHSAKVSHLTPSTVTSTSTSTSLPVLKLLNNFAEKFLSSTTAAAENITCGTFADSPPTEREFYGFRHSARVFAGQMPQQGRIVGGGNAEMAKHPWQVFLLGGGLQCGGSVLNRNWILFAAHCVEETNKHAHNWQVFAGISNQDNFFHYSQKFAGKTLIVHSKFSITTFVNDVALLELNRALEFNSFVRPICLPPQRLMPVTGSSCTISGWGLKKETDRRTPRALQSAKVKVLSRFICNLPSWLNRLVSSEMFCAGYEGGKIDGCVGDSGGPLTCLHNGRQYLFGIASWGIGCGVARKPGVYTKASSYVDWMNMYIN